ncbi:hypothetical protein CVT30_25525 [Streptomyces sp. AMCC400023]|nr:hypothetical protein CVT30_25525 [Streptomyces sp. AMCC400023]
MVLGVLAYMLWLANVDHQPALTLANSLALLATVACLAIWWVLPSPVRMKNAAERYAYELLQAAVVLAAEKAESRSGSQE